MKYANLLPRIITNFDVTICNSQDIGCASALPINMSESGICVQSKIQLKTNDIIKLEIRIFDREEPFIVDMKIAWVREAEYSNQWIYGLGFIDLKEDDKKRIRYYTEKASLSLEAFLQQYPLFSTLNLKDCRELIKIMTLRKLEKDEILFFHNTVDDDLQGLFIVQSGLLSIFKGKEHSPSSQISVVSAGEIFGETTLLLDQPHSASVKAVNETILIQISKFGFKALAKQDAELGLKIMTIIAKTLATRLGRTTKKLFSPLR